ncbi:MAG: YdcF family protein [Alphaproteobacteria bacterium]
MNAYYSYIKEKQKRKRFFSVFSFLIKCCFIILIIWIIFFFYWVHHLPTEMPPLAGTENAQSIVVLTGGKGRLPQSAEMLEQKTDARLLVSGVNPIVSSQELFKQMPELSNRLKRKVDIGRVAGSTIGNAAEAKGWMQQNSFTSAIIVTSNWHIQRSLLEFRHVMPQNYFIPSPVVSEAQQNGGEFWYLNKEWLLRLSKEFAKLSIRWVQINVMDIFS